MTSTSKQAFTRGPCIVKKGEIGDYLVVPVDKPDYVICRIANAITYIMDSDEAALPDAEFIAEAFTVAHETSLTPRQLAEQRDELVKAAKTLLMSNQVRDWDEPEAVAMRAAIAKAERGTTSQLTDDEIIELTSREAALGPDKAGGA